MAFSDMSLCGSVHRGLPHQTQVQLPFASWYNSLTHTHTIVEAMHFVADYYMFLFSVGFLLRYVYLSASGTEFQIDDNHPFVSLSDEFLVSRRF